MRSFASIALCVLFSVVTADSNAQERNTPRDRPDTARERPDAVRERPAERRAAESFKPENDRERALFEMIQQLRAEVAALRRQVASRDGDRGSLRDRPAEARRDGDRPGLREGDRPSLRDGDRPGLREGYRPSLRDGERPGLREGDRPRDGDARARTNPLMQKAAKIFAAYDKNKDKRVSFEEWLSMREGEMTDERRKRYLPTFKASAGSDDQITQEEFYRTMEKQARGKPQREGAAGRDGGAREQGPRDGDARERGPRDGDAREKSPRDRE